MPPKRKTDSADKAEPKAKKAGRDPIPDVTLLDFSSESKTKDGDPWNMKFASWNVNGIRAWMDKNAITYITTESPDIMCIQETKCDKSKIPEECSLEGYHAYWYSGEKEGYSGVGLYSKVEPLAVTYGIDVPNAGKGLVRLDYRTKKWDPAFRNYLKSLDEKKPVIMCGDLNVAHLDIDLKNPKTNKKNPGFTKEEREGFSTLLEEGQFVDSFRELYPEKEGAWTFWTYMMNARGKDIGWRLDYFVLSKRLLPNLCDNAIRKDVFGSDHCPITLFMNL